MDDDATNRRILEEVLASWGVRADSADRGETALSLMKRAVNAGNPFDLALVDCMMPEMDGFQLAGFIRADPGLSRARLLMLTSANPEYSAQRCRDVGIESCLLKPVHQSDLYNAIVGLFGIRFDTGSARPPMTERRRRSFACTTRPLDILLVEDNAFNRKVAVGMLETMGHSVRTAVDGMEGVSVASQHRFDVILIDVQMPRMNGFQAVQAIREAENGTGRRTPILAMTAYAMKEDRERCLRSGMDGYISKPINSAELFSQLEKIGQSKPYADAPPQTAPIASIDAAASPPDFAQCVVDLGPLLMSVGADRRMFPDRGIRHGAVWDWIGLKIGPEGESIE